MGDTTIDNDSSPDSHRWVRKGDEEVGFAALYCPVKDRAYGFGSKRGFNYCPRCGSKL